MRLKHIGIIAVTAPGAAICYQAIVSEAEKILGAKHNPRITLFQPPFIETFEAHERGDWNTVARVIIDSIKRVAATGAEFAVMPANTTHFAYEQITKSSPIPLLSIVDVTVAETKRLKLKKVAILGTGLTMANGLYVQPLKTAGIEPYTPPEGDQLIIKNIIYNELVLGIINTSSTRTLINTLKRYKTLHCDGALLACTELPMILNNDNSPIPVIDTTRLLAKKAVEYALS